MFRCLSTIFLVTILSGGLRDISTKAEPLEGRNVVAVSQGINTFVVSIARRPNPSHPEKRHFCTGFLITKRFVLTAAHCFSKRWAEADHNTVESNYPHAVDIHDTNMVITYDHWAESKNITKVNGTNDIALLKLSRPVTNAKISTANLSFLKPSDMVGGNVIIFGWKNLNKNTKNSPKILHTARVKVLRKQTCEHITKLFFNQTIVYPEKYLCTRGYPSAYPSSGDGGAPVLRKGQVVAINRGTCPKLGGCDLHHSVLNTDKFNVHTILYPYINFIADVVLHY